MNLLLKILVQCCLHTGGYHYLSEGCKVFEYQTQTDLLNQSETWDKGAKDWGPNAVVWL